MPLPYVVADVFTDRPLEGNGVAVFTAADGLDDTTMQRLARELNLSETVFAAPPRRGGDAAIRIFTPSAELPFAGHPVLGTAFVLARPGQEEITLETKAGDVPLALERDGDGRLRFGRMAQPLPSSDTFDAEAQLLAALGVARSELPIGAYTNGPQTLYVALEQPAGRVRPDPRHAGAGRAAGEHLLLRGRRELLARARLRPISRRPRGSGDRLGRRPALAAPRPQRRDRVRNRDRDPPGR